MVECRLPLPLCLRIPYRKIERCFYTWRGRVPEPTLERSSSRRGPGRGHLHQSKNGCIHRHAVLPTRWVCIQTHCVRSSSRHCLGGDRSHSTMHGCIHCHAVLPVHLDRHPNALCAFHLVHTLTRFASGKGRFSTAGSAASCASVSASAAQRTQNHRTVLLN